MKIGHNGISGPRRDIDFYPGPDFSIFVDAADAIGAIQVETVREIKPLDPAHDLGCVHRYGPNQVLIGQPVRTQLALIKQAALYWFIHGSTVKLHLFLWPNRKRSRME